LVQLLPAAGAWHQRNLDAPAGCPPSGRRTGITHRARHVGGMAAGLRAGFGAADVGHSIPTPARPAPLTRPRGLLGKSWRTASPLAESPAGWLLRLVRRARAAVDAARGTL